MLVHNYEIVEENLKHLENETEDAYTERLDLFFWYEPVSIIYGWEDGWSYYARWWTNWDRIEILYKYLTGKTYAYKLIYKGELLMETTIEGNSKDWPLSHQHLMAAFLVKALGKEFP